MNAPFTLKPSTSYCVTIDDANRAIDQVIHDASGAPVAIDIETASSQEEAARLAGLREKIAISKGELAAWRKIRKPAKDIAVKKAEITGLTAQAAYAASATLDPHRARIRLLQLYGGGSRVAVIDFFRTGLAPLKRLDDMLLVSHNAAFDLSFLEHHGIQPAEMHCTMQACRLTLGEHQTALADAAQAYLGIELGKSHQISDWSVAHLTLAQIKYAASDAVTCWKIFHKVMQTLGAQEPAYEIQMTAIPAVVRMELRGFRLDSDAHARMIEDLRRERVAVEAEYAKACADCGHPALAVAPVPSTPTEKARVLETLLEKHELDTWARTKKSGALSTKRSDLRRAAHYPPITALTRLAAIDKLLTSFADRLASKVSPVTGRIHASYRVAGTASGRASCSSPNLQQVPRDRRFRTLFVAASDNVLIVGDYSSVELRAAAHISGDPAMTAAFEQGVDLHRLTASRMTGKAYYDVTDEERNAAKPVNFGAIYGMGPTGLVASAWDNYGLILTESEARNWLGAFTSSYPTLARWRSDHYAWCEGRRMIVIGRDAARGIGRFFPLSRLAEGKSAYTRACNLPIQGACADASMLALAYVDEALFEAGIDGGPVAWLHDEIVLEVAAADAQRAAAILAETMTRAFAETFPEAPLKGLVDPHVGTDWGAAKHG